MAWAFILSIITLYILFMVFYYCSVHAGYQHLYCSKDYDETYKTPHNSEGGTESEIVIYEAQSIFSHKFAQVWKNPNGILLSFSYHPRLPFWKCKYDLVVWQDSWCFCKTVNRFWFGFVGRGGVLHKGKFFIK